jgi:tetratricopeptide (TPR) repeat protein
MQKKEFRRSALVDEIKSRLESRRRLLLVGESGTSKTTILMEVLTDYFAEGYEILYNLEGAEIKNGPQLVRFIEDRLERGDKILVVVDNVHTERTSAIFYAMDITISSYKYIQNIRFLLAARIPEYDWFIRDRLNQVKEGKESIRKFSKDPEFRYQPTSTDLLYFTKDEIKGFIKKYIGKEFFYQIELRGQTRMVTAADEELISNLSTTIFEETRGHPIIVKFYLLGGGLRTDVKRRYDDYLSGDSRALRVQIMLVCSLLDIRSLPITDELLQEMGLLRETYNIKNATLYRPTEGSWKTIHPRWDEELLYFLYNESDEIDEGQIYDNKEYLRTALGSVFNIKEDNTSVTQERAYSVIGTIYDIAALHVIPIDIIESVISIPSYLTDEEKAELYTYYIAGAYSTLKKFQKAIDKLNEALTFRPNFIPAWDNKGAYLYNLGRYEDAIRSYEEAIRIKPDYAEAWNNKGVSLRKQGRYEDAIRSYEEAIRIKPDYADAWYNKGYALGNLGRYEDAIRSYEEAIRIKPDDADAWYNIACWNVRKDDINKALSALEKAIEMGGDAYIRDAREDRDFDDIRNLERFKRLIRSNGAV